MKKNLVLLTMMGMATSVVLAQNPIIRDQYTADPTARVFNGKMYVYPSHDIVSPVEPEKKWFSMEDYHVFSSENLTDWTDHGVIVTQNKVPWVKRDSYAMWAPTAWRRVAIIISISLRHLVARRKDLVWEWLLPRVPKDRSNPCGDQ